MKKNNKKTHILNTIKVWVGADFLGKYNGIMGQTRVGSVKTLNFHKLWHFYHTNIMFESQHLKHFSRLNENWLYITSQILQDPEK